MEIKIAHGNKDEIALSFSTMGLAVEIPLSNSDIARIEELIEFARKNFFRKRDIPRRTFADKIRVKAEGGVPIKATLPKTTKLTGIITHSKVGGEMPFGLRLGIKLENGNGVDWVIAYLGAIYQFCRDAKVEWINELVGKPVECVFEGDGGAGCRLLECNIAKQLILEK